MITEPVPHALAAEGITKRYGRITALDDVSLNVGRGRFVTLLGPSGSGKTTLLMAIAGFVQPDSGQLLLDGKPIQHLPPEKRDFGMVFQGYALFPHLTVAENVAFPLRVRHTPKGEIMGRVREALDLVQLGAMAERLPKQLSGGQQQRVALARALVFRPSLMLLDEPLSALDKNLRVSMQDELKNLHQRVGLTFVCVTHDQEEALSLADEVAILHGGKLVQSGAPSDLYERPASRFVAGFLGRSNFWRASDVAATGNGFSYRAGGANFVQAGAIPPGTPLIALRPEKLMVLTGAETRLVNRVTATVAVCSYLGDAWLVQVDVAELGRLQLVIPTWRGIQPRPGDIMQLGWDPDASVAVTDDEDI